MSETENQINEMCGQVGGKKDTEWFLLLFLLFMSGNPMPDFRVNEMEKQLAELKGRVDTLEKVIFASVKRSNQ